LLNQNIHFGQIQNQSAGAHLDITTERGLQSAAFWRTQNRAKRTKVRAPILPGFA